MRILISGLLLLATIHAHRHHVDKHSAAPPPAEKGGTRTVNGSIGHSVLLPCKCTGRDSERGFKWQMESPHVKPVFIYNHSETFGYKDRITTFVDQDPYDCSIFLSEIKMKDNGTYSCRFSEPAYKNYNINLIVSAEFDVCERRVSENVFQCDVKGLYEEAMIQWRLNGRTLTDSPTVKITENHAQDGNATHTFSSQLISTVNMTSEPTCHVKAGDTPFIITSLCPDTEPIIEEPVEPNVWMYFIIIPIIVGILGIITFSVRRHRLSRWGERVNTEEEI